MAQNVKIAGALFSNVPSIQVPDQNDVYHPFVDTSDATASAGTILNGYTAYINGTKVTGTHSDSVSTTDYFAQFVDGVFVYSPSITDIDTSSYPFYVYKVVSDAYETMVYNKTITTSMWDYDDTFDLYTTNITTTTQCALVLGDTYRVTWDGYTSVLTAEEDSYGGLYIGSKLADDQPDRHPEFEFEIYKNRGYAWGVYCTDNYEHTVNVEHLVE